MDVIAEELDERFTANVIVLTGVEISEQAVSLQTFHSISTEEIAYITSRDSAIVIWA
jgi:hypothetical protein